MLNPNIIGTSGKIFSGKDTVGKLILMHIHNSKQTDLKLHKIPEQIENDNKYRELESFTGYEIKKFAYKLKLFVSILTGIPIDDLEKAEVKDSKLGDEWAYLIWFNGKNMLRVNPNRWTDFEPHRLKNYTVSEMFQFVGTELFRNQFHEDVWVNALFADYDCYDGNKWRFNEKGTSTNSKPNWMITDVRFPNEAEAIKKRNGLLIQVINPEYKPYDNEHYSETALDNYQGFNNIIINDKKKGLNFLSDTVLDIIKSHKII
jgi:hypothetical protein